MFQKQHFGKNHGNYGNLWWEKKQSNREVSKISALLSRTIDKYEYFTEEDIWISDQSRMIEQTKFTYFPFR